MAKPPARPARLTTRRLSWVIIATGCYLAGLRSEIAGVVVLLTGPVVGVMVDKFRSGRGLAGGVVGGALWSAAWIFIAIYLESGIPLGNWPMVAAFMVGAAVFGGTLGAIVGGFVRLVDIAWSRWSTR